MNTKFTLITCFLLLFGIAAHASNGSAAWTKNENPDAAFSAKANTWATAYAPLTLNMNDIKNYLLTAPDEKNVSLRNSSFIFSIPKPDGSFESFKLVNSPVMEQGLADAFPDIKTFAGQGIDDPTATMRCDITQFGFHAMVISINGTYFIDPLDLNTTTDYTSYYKHDAINHNPNRSCGTPDKNDEEEITERIGHVNQANRSINGELRTYRLALACTGEYAATKGGTVAGALAGMTTSMTRVNGVYEREFGIHMNIIANNTLIIYTNSATDPFTNLSNSATLTTNNSNCNSVIGSANYDIGHVFNTADGGIAGLGVVCGGSKGQGSTGLPNPTGDSFDIDYVAHEMGHQFGGNHTFNNNTVGSCAGNRAAGAAYEPGSGSTIMAYAGICGSQDLQTHSDDYFHTKSFDEIINYTQISTGNNCPVLTTVSNSAPTFVNISPNYTIPLGTPFRLIAAGTDPDGDPITYCWEEYDLGPEGTWNAPSGNAPIFRSFDPVTSGTRLIPKLSNILSNLTNVGELKATYARSLRFRCTLRDNILAGAGVTYNDTPVTLTVASSGPFEITSQGTTGISYQGGSTQTVTWNVNNTTAAPVNCANVNVLFSIDNGTTFPTTLGTAVPNNGSFSFTVPNVSTTTARLMVEGVGNIFFDINNRPFSITPLSVGENAFGASINLYPNPSADDVIFAIINTERGKMDVTVTDNVGRVVKNFTVNKNNDLLNFNLEMSTASKGVYFVKFKTDKSETVKRVVKI